MKKTAVVYWSSTGNTEAMAKAIADAVNQNGGEATEIEASAFSADDVSKYDTIAFGCPAMGAEVLEESEFEPMFASVESSLSGKKIGLFGSWGWGEGAWMEDWKDRCVKDGAVLVADPVICQEAPDAVAIAACEDLGKALVTA